MNIFCYVESLSMILERTECIWYIYYIINIVMIIFLSLCVSSDHLFKNGKGNLHLDIVIAHVQFWCVNHCAINKKKWWNFVYWMEWSNDVAHLMTASLEKKNNNYNKRISNKATVIEYLAWKQEMRRRICFVLYMESSSQCKTNITLDE